MAHGIICSDSFWVPIFSRPLSLEWTRPADWQDVPVCAKVLGGSLMVGCQWCIPPSAKPTRRARAPTLATSTRHDAEHERTYHVKLKLRSRSSRYDGKFFQDLIWSDLSVERVWSITIARRPVGTCRSSPLHSLSALLPPDSHVLTFRLERHQWRRRWRRQRRRQRIK